MSQSVALLLSLLLEVPVVLGIAWWREWGDLRQLLLVALAATLLTHPFAWSGVTWIAPHLPFPYGWTLIEGLVTGFEAVLYATLGAVGVKRGVLLSVAANGCSAGIGLVLFFFVLPT